MTIGAWILSGLGLLLALLMALAAGMKTVPRFTDGDLLVACLLPGLAILLALLALRQPPGETERSGVRQLADVGAIGLALTTIVFACHSWAFQPSTPPLAKTIRQHLGLGNPRWQPDTARWEAGDRVVTAEQHHEIRPVEGEGRLVLGEESREGLTWRRLRYRGDPGSENSVVISSSATLATLHQSGGLIHGDLFFMGMGDHLLALRLPGFEEAWRLTPPAGRLYSLFAENEDLVAIGTEGAFRFQSQVGTIDWIASIEPQFANGHFECAHGILTLQDTRGGHHRFSLRTGAPVARPLAPNP